MTRIILIPLVYCIREIKFYTFLVRKIGTLPKSTSCIQEILLMLCVETCISLQFSYSLRSCENNENNLVRQLLAKTHRIYDREMEGDEIYIRLGYVKSMTQIEEV